MTESSSCLQSLLVLHNHNYDHDHDPPAVSEVHKTLPLRGGLTHPFSSPFLPRSVMYRQVSVYDLVFLCSLHLLL